MIARAGPDPDSRSGRPGWLYAITGAIGLAAAATLLIEKIELIEDPSYVPSCSINPILSCGSIMVTDQAELLGFPNPIIGVAGFAIVLTTGMALLAGGELRRWFWNGLLAGTTAGLLLVHWLIFQSLYRIGALCPYCMVVWIVTIAAFWYTALRQARTSRWLMDSPAAPVARFANEYHSAILTLWYLIIAGLITKRFWDYWSTLLP